MLNFSNQRIYILDVMYIINKIKLNEFEDKVRLLIK